MNLEPGIVILILILAAMVWYGIKHKAAVQQLVADLRDDGKLNRSNVVPVNHAEIVTAALQGAAAVTAAAQPKPMNEAAPERPVQPVLQPNVGLAGFRISPEAAAILEARVREDAGLPPAPPPPTSLPPMIDKQARGQGMNHYITFAPVRQSVGIAPGMRVDVVAAADSPARTGTIVHLVVKDAAGNVLAAGGDVVNASTIYAAPAGAATLEYWSDEPATCWVVFR